MSDNEVEELSQEQYNAGRDVGNIDEHGHTDDDDDQNAEPATYVKPEGSEGTPKPVGDPPPEPAPKRPWQKAGDDDGMQDGIPNSRFAATRIQLREKDRVIEEALAKIASLEKPAEVEITDPNQIDKAKFVGADGAFDGEGYLAAREAVVRKQAVADIRREFHEQEQQRAVTTLVDSYISSVQEESKTNPEIVDAVKHLDQYAAKIPSIVLETMMRMPPAVSFAIACDDAHIAQLINGKPAESIALLGELKAMAKHAKAVVPAPEKPAAPTAFKPQSQAQAKPVPRTVGGGGSSSRKAPEDETQDEYNRRRARESAR